MPWIVIWVLTVAIARTVRERRKAPARSLCTDCIFAHVQYGMNGKRAIACTFGGAVRPVAMDVLYCTDYSNRNVPRRVVTIGFAPEMEATELAEAATLAP